MQQQLLKPHQQNRRAPYQENEQLTPGDLALDMLYLNIIRSSILYMNEYMYMNIIILS